MSAFVISEINNKKYAVGYNPNSGDWLIDIGSIIAEENGFRYGNKHIGYDGYVVGSKCAAAAAALLFDHRAFLWRKTRGYSTEQVLDLMVRSNDLDSLIVWSGHRVCFEETPEDKTNFAKSVLRAASKLIGGHDIFDTESHLYVGVSNVYTPTVMYDTKNERFLWGVKLNGFFTLAR